MDGITETAIGNKRPKTEDNVAIKVESASNSTAQEASHPPPAKKVVPAPVAQQPTAAQSALQRQIQQQLQEQLQQQLQAAAARGQQAHITPAQIQAQAAAMVQAAAQAQAVVAAARARSPNNQLQPMSASQIAALSQIQAAAIVNSRRNTAAAAAAASGSNEKSKMENMTQAQIQTQIQIQAQALIHAHTQAQIQAGIYKGDDTAAAAPTKTTTTAVATTVTSTTKPVARSNAQSHPPKATVQADAAPQSRPNLNISLSTGNETTTNTPSAIQSNSSVVSSQTTTMGPITNATSSSTMINTHSMMIDQNNLSNQMMDLSATHDSNSPVFQQQLQGALQEFWTQASQQIQNLQNQTEQDFKTHNDLPLARIKRIMKSDEDVRMISAEAPVLFAKACELFILDLSVRSWNYSQLHKRRTLQKEDVKEAIQKTEIFDFLVDVIQ
jgi:nuclear transcription factor Y, gamma